MRFFVVLFLFVLGLSSAKAQTPIFAKSVIVPDAQQAYSKDLLEINPNLFFMLGFTYDTTASGMRNQLTLVAVDSTGDRLWKKSYSNPNYDYTAVIGSFRLMLKGNSTIFCALTAVDTTSKYFGILLKLDFQGNLV